MMLMSLTLLGILLGGILGWKMHAGYIRNMWRLSSSIRRRAKGGIKR